MKTAQQPRERPPVRRQPIRNSLLGAVAGCCVATAALAQDAVQVRPLRLNWGVEQPVGQVPRQGLPVPPTKAAPKEVVRPLSDAPETRALLDRAMTALAHGREDEALAVVADRPDEDIAASIVFAVVGQRYGRDADARLRLARVVARDAMGDTALELGLLLLRLGQRDEAEALLGPLITLPDDTEAVAPLLRAARAAQALSRSRVANSYFKEAAAAAPDAPAVHTAWGTLLLERHNDAEALESFKRAIETDAQYAPALLGLARALAERNPPAAVEQAKAALAIDPKLADAHLVRAEVALDSRRAAEARTAIDAALAINPRSSRALALRAAVAAVEGRQAEFEASVAGVLVINPRDASAYRIPADAVAGHYRFEEAVRLARKAVAVDPEDPLAQASLGMHLMRTGEEDAARAALEAAFEGDPFDVVTFNLLGLLDTLQSFETVRHGDLVFRLPAEEAPVLRDLAPAMAREAIAAMSQRYGFTPSGPLLIEMFNKHDDFAVRTAGLPGMVGALGACFGKVVTLDSPRAANPPGAFHWGATLWHELAHVFTLQMSNQRVPRWLTEGTSVFEERRAREQWGRESEFDFVQAVADGKAIPLADLNAAFSDPRRIALAYQQASYVVEMIVSRDGEEALHGMLRAYGAGQDDTAVFAGVLKQDVAQLQASFDGYIDQRYGAMAKALKTPEGVEVEGADPAALARAADQHPGSYHLQMAAADALLESDAKERAVPYLERAHQLVPIAGGAHGPQATLARVLLEQGEKARAMAEFESVLDGDLTSLDEARKLAELATESGDTRRGLVAHSRITELAPFESASHSALGRIALGEGDLDTAARRFRWALATGPDDVPAARTDHAEVLVASGQRELAKQELLSALQDAPLYERAQDLLLKVVEPPARNRRQP